MIELCHEAEAIFCTEPSLIDIQSPCLLVGDLHGHVLDLYRILKYCGIPDDEHMDPKYRAGHKPTLKYDVKKILNTKYVFLGDLIDRGEFSVETITIVFLLKVLYPSNVFIIRGNHEFDYLARQCGFYSQISSTFSEYGNFSRSQNTFTEKLMTLKKDSPGSEVYTAFMSAFSYLPFGVRVDGKMLCIHGGIGPKVFNAESVASIVRPINDFGVNEIVDSILWSDPKSGDNKQKNQTQNQNQQQQIKASNSITITDTTFSEPAIEPLKCVTQKNGQGEFDRSIFFTPSNRGSGFLFGYSALDHFLKASGLEVLVRAHECVIDGCEEVFNGRLITVFSASNYCGFVRNYSAVLCVKGKDDQTADDILGRCQVFRFYPLEYLKRPTPVTINISSNLDTFSESNVTPSGRVIELSGYYRRYSSDVTKKTPLSQLLQTPLNKSNANSASNPGQANRNDAELSGLQNASLHDPHKLAGLKSAAPRPSFVRHDVSKFRQNSILNKLKRNQTHQVELPSFAIPAPVKQQGSQLDVTAASQAPIQTMSKRFSPAAICATSKLKDRPSSEFKP